MRKRGKAIIYIIGLVLLAVLIPGIAMANTVSETRNATDGIYVGKVTWVSTTGGILGSVPGPSGIAHEGMGEVRLSSGILSEHYKTGVIEFYGVNEDEKIYGGDIGLKVKGIERYDSSGKLVFGATRVWVWGVSFNGGWDPLNEKDYISSVSDTPSGPIT